MCEITEYVPSEKVKKFDELLKQYGGKYLSAPYKVQTDYRMHYLFEDSENYRKFYTSFYKLSTPITEKESSKMTKLTRKIKCLFRLKR